MRAKKPSQKDPQELAFTVGEGELREKPEQGRQWKSMKEENLRKMSIGQCPLALALQLALTLASRLLEGVRGGGSRAAGG